MLKFPRWNIAGIAVMLVRFFIRKPIFTTFFCFIRLRHQNKSIKCAPFATFRSTLKSESKIVCQQKLLPTAHWVASQNFETKPKSPAGPETNQRMTEGIHLNELRCEPAIPSSFASDVQCDAFFVRQHVEWDAAWRRKSDKLSEMNFKFDD